jgi:hypothetical protein
MKLIQFQTLTCLNVITALLFNDTKKTNEAKVAHAQLQGPSLTALLINLKQILQVHEIKLIVIGL